MENTITVTRNGYYRRLPEYQASVDLEGMTLRQALVALRSVDWGDIGRCVGIELSDGTTVNIELTPAIGGGSLTRTQRAIRYRSYNKVRTYKIA